MDQVNKVIKQWEAARPDVDTSTMGPIARLNRASKKILTVEEKTFSKYRLNLAGFDVLSTLRRSGSPYALTVGELMASMMITSGTMTNRIDQLEKIGFVQRIPDPQDARRFIVSLTPEGFSVIDNAIVEHVATQHELLKGLTTEELAQLDSLLQKLTKSLDI